MLDTDRQGGLTGRSVPMMRGHAEALMPMIAAVMSAAGMEFAALDRIAVTVGPGSFTGLRVGVAAARGIALAAGKPAVGLTTLAALAAPFFDATTPRRCWPPSTPATARSTCNCSDRAGAPWWRRGLPRCATRSVPR